MLIDVYEKGVLQIKARLKERSKKSTDVARLFLDVDGTDGVPIGLSVAKKELVHRHVFDDVPQDKDNYQVAYRITHRSETIRGSDTYRVWPAAVKVTLKREDNTVLPNVHFDLRYHDDSSHGRFRSGNDGSCVCFLHKSTYSFPNITDLVFVRWEPGANRRERVAIVRPATYKATLVTPAGWAGTEVTQSVNVASAQAGDTLGHDKQGRSVKFNLKLTNTNDPGQTAPAGESLYIKATLSEMTKRTAELPTLVGVLDLVATATELTGRVQSGVAGKASFTLKLGLGGKEKLKLQMGTTPECTDAEVKFVNARKLWLESIARAGAKPALADATAAMKKVGVELLEEPDVDVAGANPPAGSMVPGRHFGLGSPQLVVGDHNINSFTTLWAKPHAPLGAYAVFCDYQFDAGENGPETADLYYDVPMANIVWPPTGVNVGGFQVAPCPRGRTLLPVDLRGNDSVTGEWYVTAPPNHPQLWQSTPLPADHIHVDWVNNPDRAIIKLPGAVVNLVSGGATVQVHLQVTTVKGPYNGWAPDPPKGGVVIALRNRAGANGLRAAAGMNQTVVHELGHLLNLVADVPGRGTGMTLEDDHDRHYRFRGHSGGHCATGVGLVTYRLGGDLSGNADATCVMYGEGSSTRKIDFCAKCAPFVLVEPMERLV